MSSMRFSVALALLLSCAFNTAAKEANNGLAGCLDTRGKLYNVTPQEAPAKPCNAGDLRVQLGRGSITGVAPLGGLAGGGISGDVGIGIDPKFALPPSCPPGQVALSDDKGAWICTPTNQLRRPQPSAKVWVIPAFSAPVYQEGECNGSPPFCVGTPLDFSLGTQAYFFNASNHEGAVSCYWFTRNGGWLLDLSVSKRLPAGGSNFCQILNRFTPSSDRADWMLVVSAVDIVVSAETEQRHFERDRESAKSWNNVALPVDCRYPEGYEFVCAFAK